MSTLEADDALHSDPETWQFGKYLIVQVTAQCPLECAHCIVSSGPDRLEQFSTADLVRLIEDVAADGRTEVIVFTGGEPFLKRARLHAGLEAVRRAGLRAGIVTSGSWAASEERARQILATLPFDVIAEITFSADRHHLPFLSLNHVKHGAAAALSLDIPVRVSICLDGDDDDFLDRFKTHMGPDLLARMRLRLIQTHRAGRAAIRPEFARLARPVPFADLPDQTCSAPSAPAVCPDGRIMACCSDTVSDPGNWAALELGHSSHDPHSTILDRADNSPLIQALRVFGPKHLAMIAVKAGALAEGHADANNICDICRRAVTDPAALEAIEDYLRQPDVRDEIAVRRLLLYGEMVGSPSGEVG